jgi:hypothetical protein
MKCTACGSELLGDTPHCPCLGLAERRVAELEAVVGRVKDKLRHHYASGDFDQGHNCRASITLNALRQSLGL